MKKDTLDTKQAKAFNNTGFTFKGVKYKGFNLALLSILGEIESTFFTTQDLRGVLDYLFIASHDSDEVRDLIDNGTIKKAILKYGENFEFSDIKDIQELIKIESDKVESMMVDVRGGDDDSKKK